ncbi:hypothetical protein BH09BAC2_BH09BAC2_17750 [soil metagenome]
METAIVKEKEKFEALFQNASLGILVANKEGQILLVNNFLIFQFGYDNDKELIGKNIRVLIPQRFSIHHDHYMHNYSEKPERRPMGMGRDLFGIKKTGEEFPVEISLSHYQNDEGFFAIASVIDITKRKEIENAVINHREELATINIKIEKLNDELEHKVATRTQELQETLQKLEQSKDELTKALSKEKELGDLKSRFVTMASHEFRTPLSTILSSASLAGKYTLTDEQQKREKHMQRIKSSVNNLTNILNEFLSLGKIEEGKVFANFSLFNLREFINNLIQEIQLLLKPGQNILVDYKGDNEVNLDPSLLKNILLNLLSNAIKFSSENNPIHIHAAVAKEFISVTVADSGIGISPEDQKHLSERFFRGTNATNIQGTGIGLHIVNKYAELMNGEVLIKSKIEKGTQITIKFKI